MTDPAARSESPRHPIEVDIGGFEEIVAEAQAVLHTEDEGVTVRRMLDAFVLLAQRDSATGGRDVRAAVRHIFAECKREAQQPSAEVQSSALRFDSDDFYRLARARGYGMDRGTYIVPSDFDAPLAEDVLTSFES